MIISDLSIDRRVPVVVLSLLIILFGLYSYIILPRESTPDITIPNVFITTSHKGVSPPDMETSITIPIEKKLTGLENVKKIKSVSSEGLSSIIIEFTTGTNIDDVIQKVKDKVDEAHSDLPSDLEEDPSVFEVNFSDMPIVVFSLSGTISPARLKETADDLADSLETIPGILEVEVTGGREREIRVEMLPEKLAYFGLSPQELENTLRSENQNISGGVIHMADGRFQLQTPGELKEPQDFFGLIVGTHAGLPVFLADVAEVKDGYKDETSRSRLDGKPAVTLSVKKRSGENIIKISDQIDQLIKDQQPTWPLGTKITKLLDSAKDIRNMVADLENNLITGLILVLLVLPFALGLRNAILVALAIPFSMFLSFSILQAMGITLNMVVLYSLTLALGMLVDNAIVIIENIYRYTSQGVGRLQAAKRATSEVAYPVIGSTITTLAAFFPMLFWPGIMGEFMSYLPLTLIITLSSSLFVALVINPALASLFLKVGPNNTTQSKDADLGENPVAIRGHILLSYRWLLNKALDSRIAVLGTAFSLLALVFMVWLLRIGLEKPVEFFPAIDPISAYVNIDMPEGADLEFCDRIVRQVEMAIAGMPANAGDNLYIDSRQYTKVMTDKEHSKSDESHFSSKSDLANVQHLFSTAVATNDGIGDIFGGNAPNHVGIQFIAFKDKISPAFEDVSDIRQRVKNIPGAKITVDETKEGPPTGAPINIEISGDDFAVLGLLAKKIRGIAEKTPFVEDVRDDYEEGTPTIRLNIDKQKASMLGLSSTAIAQALKNAFNGQDVSTYHEEDEEYDITIQLPYRYRNNIEILQNLLIPSSHGRLIPLSTIASIEYTGSLGRIVRINNKRVVTVKANVDENKIPAPVVRAQVEKLLKTFELPPGYQISFTGEQEEQEESENFLKKAFLVAIVLVLLVLITQFNSVAQPLIIITSVILSLGGAFLGLALFKMSFGIIMTGVGVISLAGVVVNNAIVLIDYTNKLYRRGMSCRAAVIAAGCTRLRPVLLTAITTILGLIPMVTGVSFDFHTMAISWVSESSQWWRSMAMAVIFGLLVATGLTLFVVPILYSLSDSIPKSLKRSIKSTSTFYWEIYDRLF